MKYNITVNGKKYEVEIEKSDTAPENAASSSNTLANIKNDVSKANKNGNSAEAVTSPMPGSILEIKVTNGQSVKKGDVLLILEAMKMENEILAGYDGIVSEIAVSKGTNVNTGDLLLTLKHAEEGA